MEEETLILINILHDDTMKYGFNGPCWREVIDEFWLKSDKKDTCTNTKLSPSTTA